VKAWWREHHPRAGFWATSQTLCAILWEFLRDSMPDRSRQRFGDVEYDWEHRVDTTSANVSWKARLIGLLHSSYQPIESDLFQEMLGSLRVDYRDFTFVDIGSGKGRALLMAAAYPFRRIVGVELLPELNAIAQENIRKVPKDRPCDAIETVQGDAREFLFPPEPLVIFMFHPLPESGFRKVMENLRSSLKHKPRPAWLIYANPLFEPIVFEITGFTKTAGTHQYSIFNASA